LLDDRGFALVGQPFFDTQPCPSCAASGRAAERGDVTMASFDDGRSIAFEPWTDGGVVGFRCTDRGTGAVSFVYLNPSTAGASPDVFVYQGPRGDPAHDSPICFVDIEFEPRAGRG
jgi:hypothetical protein